MKQSIIETINNSSPFLLTVVVFFLKRLLDKFDDLNKAFTTMNVSLIENINDHNNLKKSVDDNSKDIIKIYDKIDELQKKVYGAK